MYVLIMNSLPAELTASVHLAVALALGNKLFDVSAEETPMELQYPATRTQVHRHGKNEATAQTWFDILPSL